MYMYLYIYMYIYRPSRELYVHIIFINFFKLLINKNTKTIKRNEGISTF